MHVHKLHNKFDGLYLLIINLRILARETISRNFLRAIFIKLTVHFTEIIRKYSALRFNLMFTDDSFVFSNLLYQIKLELNALPNVTQEEKLNYNSIIKTFRCNTHVMKNTYFVRMVQHILSHAFLKKENIFSFYPNLNHSRNVTTIYENRKMNKFPKDRLAIKSKSTLNLYRREYILELLESLKILHKKKWAKSSIESLWEYSYLWYSKFTPGQQQKRVEDLWICSNRSLTTKYT